MWSPCSLWLSLLCFLFPLHPWFSTDHPQLQRNSCSGGKYAHDSQAKRHLALSLERLCGWAVLVFSSWAPILREHPIFYHISLNLSLIPLQKLLLAPLLFRVLSFLYQPSKIPGSSLKGWPVKTFLQAGSRGYYPQPPKQAAVKQKYRGPEPCSTSHWLLAVLDQAPSPSTSSLGKGTVVLWLTTRKPLVISWPFLLYSGTKEKPFHISSRIFLNTSSLSENYNSH